MAIALAALLRPLLALAFAPTVLSAPSPTPSAASTADDFVNQTTCNGQTYTYTELAGYGFVASDARDKFGDTLGGYGSSITIDGNTWTLHSNGTYTGTLWAIPDRGWNTEGTLNYQSRIHKFAITFTPNASASVSDPSGPNLDIAYQDTVLFTDPNGTPCTGLDADVAGFASFPGFPPLPVADYIGDGFGGDGNGGQRVSLDTEGLVLASDGSFWISDEYGPYIYHFSSNGSMLAAIAPPDAFVPHRNGSISFSADSPPVYDTEEVILPEDPATGRSNNQGFEGLSLSPDGKTLNVLLQSALNQEGGLDSATRQYSRFLSYDIATAPPTLVAEHVVPLPLYATSKSKSKVAAQSEIHAITSTQFLVLARDSGNGYGQGKKNTESLYRHLDVFDISNATNLQGTAVDAVNGSIATTDGVLDAGVGTATYCSWLDFNVNSQLGRFGLHNGGDEDSGLLNEKWESIAVVPVTPSQSSSSHYSRDAEQDAASSKWVAGRLKEHKLPGKIGTTVLDGKHASAKGESKSKLPGKIGTTVIEGRSEGSKSKLPGKIGTTDVDGKHNTLAKGGNSKLPGKIGTTATGKHSASSKTKSGRKAKLPGKIGIPVDSDSASSHPPSSAKGAHKGKRSGAATQDVYIFSFSDNDFITQNGFMDFGAFSYADSTGYNVNNQALVFKATVPASDE